MIHVRLTTRHHADAGIFHGELNLAPGGNSRETGCSAPP
jgi:hypothetical protein